MEQAWNRLLASSVGCIVAETLTLPMDVIKTRLQVQKVGQYGSTADCAKQIFQQEGFGGLYKGLAPALIRQVSYSSLAMVLFEPIRDLTTFSNNPGYINRLFAGGTAGAIGIAIMNPTEVLKTQMQSAKTEVLTMGSVLTKVWRNDGVFGFWAGVRPNIARCFLVNAAELGTYDQAKDMLIRNNIVRDGPGAHIGASTIAGFVSAAVSTPVDVVKTRLMNQAGGSHEYGGMTDALQTMLREEKFTSLYKGFTPILIRKVSWCCFFFVTYEEIRQRLGLLPKN